MRDHALVLFSGGQDSTTCLAWALSSFARVETIGFRYGQRHAVELECRPKILSELRRRFPAWSASLGEDRVLDLDVIRLLGATALTEDIQIRMTESGLPNTFVPGRNLLFFTVAAALACRLGVRTLVGGMCETDFSGYPDCRDDTLKALQVTLSLGMDTRFTIETPLMWIDKAQTFALAEDLGGKPLLEIIAEHTHTCYLGNREPHDWGPGCGECPACKLRQDGWSRYRSSKAERRTA
jgi:7-cyano-7-deazaguanine synthase